MKKYIIAVLFMAGLMSAKSQYWFNEPIVILDTARLQIIYQLTYIDDTNHINFKKNEKQILIVGNEASCYQSYNYYKFNKIGRYKCENGLLNDWLSSGEISSEDFSHEFFYRIYKNHADDNITTTERIFTIGSFKYVEDKDCFKWTIMHDTDSINGFITQKAICDFGGRQWEAWFALELPFTDGPYKFCGLPGLILKISDVKNHYTFEMVSVEVPEYGTMVEYIDREDYISTTKKEFFKVSDDNNKNIVNVIKDFGGGATDAQRANEYETSKNNPLELDRK